MNGLSGRYWFGITDEDSEGVWKNIYTGENAYVKWRGGEPNGDDLEVNYLVLIMFAKCGLLPICFRITLWLLTILLLLDTLILQVVVQTLLFAVLKLLSSGNDQVRYEP